LTFVKAAYFRPCHIFVENDDVPRGLHLSGVLFGINARYYLTTLPGASRFPLPSFCASPKNFLVFDKDPVQFERLVCGSACGGALCRARGRDSARVRLRSILPVRSKDCSDTSRYFAPSLFVPSPEQERSSRYLELTHSKRAFGGASRRVGMGATASPWRKNGS
jgi:hypothetical protein